MAEVIVIEYLSTERGQHLQRGEPHLGMGGRP